MAYDIGAKIGIDGEKEFRDAIKNINTNMRTLGTEMLAVTSQFDKNEKSAESLTAKNQVLNKQIEEQKKKLAELTKGLEASSEKYDKNDKITQSWQQAVNKATADLNNLERELKQNAEALDDFGNEMDQASSKSGKLDKALSGLKTGLGHIGSTLSKAAATGIKAIGAAALGAGAGLVAMTESTREYRTDLSMLEQNAKSAGNSFDTMKEELSGITALTGEADSSIEALSNLMATGFNDSQITQTVDALSGAVIKFPDTLKIESLADGLQETLATGAATGPFAELIERMGGNLEDFNLQLAEATTEAERQQVALDWLAKSGLAEVNAQYQETNKQALSAAEAQFKLNDSMAGLSEIVEPSITTLKGGLADILVSLIDVVKGTEGADKDFTESITNFADNVLNMVTEMIPTLSTTLQALIPALVSGISGALPLLATAAIDILLALTNELVAALPQLIPVAGDMLMTLVNGIVQALPGLMTASTEVIFMLVDSIMKLLPNLIPSAIQIIVTLAQGIINALPQLIDRIPEIVQTMVSALIENAPLIIDAALEIIMTLAGALIENIPLIIEATIKIIGAILSYLIGGIINIITFVPKLFGALTNEFKNINWWELGSNIISGIVEGVKNAARNLVDSVIDAAAAALDGVKDFLGINSPSTVMRDQVGKMMGAGVAIGITDSVREVNAAMEDLTAFNLDDNVVTSNRSFANNSNIVMNVYNTVRSDDDIKKINRGLRQELNNYSRAIGVTK